MPRMTWHENVEAGQIPLLPYYAGRNMMNTSSGLDCYIPTVLFVV